MIVMRVRTLPTLFVLLTLLSAFTLGYYLSTHRLSYRVITVSDVEELVFDVANEVSIIRGLTFKELPNTVIINSSAVIATWGDGIPSNVVVLGEVLKMTLLTPKDYNISKSYRALLGMWVAASAGNTIYVVSDNLGVEDALLHRILAHELTHVLQYQYFTLPTPKNLDESLALKSLIEGDADLVADTYVERKGFKGVIKITKLLFEDPFISLQLIPYVFGGNFVRKLLDVGGWELINKVYGEPPKSMKHVMFPEKYLSGELTINVTSSVNCNVVYDDVLGPSYIYVMIGKHFNESLALRISSSWVGDRVMYCDDGLGKYLEWRVRWTSNEVAAEFRRMLDVIATMYGGVLIEDELYFDGLVINVEVWGDEVVMRSLKY